MSMGGLIPYPLIIYPIRKITGSGTVKKNVLVTEAAAVAAVAAAVAVVQLRRCLSLTFVKESPNFINFL